VFCTEFVTVIKVEFVKFETMNETAASLWHKTRQKLVRHFSTTASKALVRHDCIKI